MLSWKNYTIYDDKLLMFPFEVIKMRQNLNFKKMRIFFCWFYGIS